MNLLTLTAGPDHSPVALSLCRLPRVLGTGGRRGRWGLVLGSFELSEIIGLVFLLAALVITAVARAHPANTPRTRLWWGRFVGLLALLTLSQVATNVEQPFPADSLAREVWNLLEHLSEALAGLWACVIAFQGLVEALARQDDKKETPQ